MGEVGCTEARGRAGVHRTPRFCPGLGEVGRVRWHTLRGLLFESEPKTTTGEDAP